MTKRLIGSSTDLEDRVLRAGVAAGPAAEALVFHDVVGLLALSNDRTARALFAAGRAAHAKVGVDPVMLEALTGAGRTAVLQDVRLVFVAEETERAQDRVGRGLPQAAERGFPNRRRELLQVKHAPEPLQAPNFVAHGPLAEAAQDFVHPSGPLPAGRAFPAGLVPEELHEELGHVDHAGPLVHHHHSAGAHHGSQPLQEE